MTTIDMRINRVSSNDRLYLHNGMWGPATAVFHALYHGCIDGTITGSWSGAHVDAVTSGAIVRAALGHIEGRERPYRQDGNEERLAAFIGRLQDEAHYEVHALEV
jgi:hypothetical protein